MVFQRKYWPSVLNSIAISSILLVLDEYYQVCTVLDYTTEVIQELVLVENKGKLNLYCCHHLLY